MPDARKRLITTPTTADGESRTIEAVVSTGAPVRRRYGRPDGSYGPWVEKLAIGGADLARLNAGAPVLLDHYPVADAQVGVVERARVERGQVVAVLRFSDARPEADAVWHDVVTGIRRSLSVGYQVMEWQRDPSSNPDEPTFTATRWAPLEVSVTPIGADPTAQFRSSTTEGLRTMTVTTMAEPEPAESPAPDAAAAVAAESGTLAERRRVSEILKRGARIGVGQDMIQRAIADGTSVDRFTDAALNARADAQEEAWGRGFSNSPEPVSFGRAGRIVQGFSGDDPAFRLEAMSDAIALRHVPGFKARTGEAARQFAGLSLKDMAVELNPALRRGHGDWLARAGLHTTSDFGKLLSAATGKFLEAGYSIAPPALKAVAAKRTARDFKAQMALQIGDFPQLAQVNEHGEFKSGTMGERGESYQLATYGRVFGITRQALVNDDLGAFADLAMKIGMAATSFEADQLAATLAANPTLSDGVAVFHATHGNLAASGSAIGVASVGAGRAAMRKQTSTDGQQVINVGPRFLVVPAAKELEAEQLVANITAAKAADANPFAGRLEVVAEARLDATSATAWYLAADPAALPCLAYAYLEGQEGVQVATKEGFEVDGMQWRARLDFVAFWMDHRGWWRDPGA